ncbi:uncharacterized protein [Euphorbia lathyris]|uniref:uncharacterized protein isoform X2 n=1 Tax=Euphorbia lathyris TaxID=212925 RepID=UPI0033139381
MGNEMGNNNTSQFREEDNRSPETEGKAQEPLHSNHLKEENHVPTPESKYYHEKETQLPSDDPKTAADTNGKEQEETEVLQNITEESGRDSGFQTTAPLPDSEYNCQNLKDSVSKMSKHHIENVAAFNKEEKDMIALPHDPECEDSAEHESRQVGVGQSEQGNTNSPKAVEEISSLLDISESNIDFITKEMSDESDNHIFDNSEGGVVPSTVLDTGKSTDCLANEVESKEDRRLRDEQLVKVGNEDAKDKIEKKNDGEVDSNKTNSLESQAESQEDSRLSDEQLVRAGNEDEKDKIENKNDGEIDSNGTNSLKSQAESQEGTRLNDEQLVRVENEHAKAKTEDKNDGEMDSNGTNSLESQAESQEHTRLSNEQLARAGNGNGDAKAKIEKKNDGEIDSNGTNSLESQAESQEDSRLSNVQLVRVENEYGKAKTENKNDGEMDSNGTNLLDSQAEFDMDDSLCSDVAMAVDKCIILTEETKLAAKESENGDSKHDANESDSEVDQGTNSSTGPNCKNDEKEDPNIAAHNASSNGILQVEGMKVTEESYNQNKPSEAPFRGSEAKSMMVHWHETFAGKPNGNEKGNSEPVSSEGRIELVPELVNLTSNLSVINGTCSKEESEDYKSEEVEPEKEQTFEIEAKTQAPVLVPASLLESVDQQHKTATECEDAQVHEESSSEVKLERSSELLREVASPFHAANTSMEKLIPAVELPIEKHEEAEAEAVLLHAPEIDETLTETNVSASENHSSEQHQEFKSSISENRDGIQAPEDATSASNGLFPESSTTIEKTQVPQCSKGVMETVIEAKLSASDSAEQSNKQSEKKETCISERVANEEQESVGRFSIESIPDPRAEMRKSPSFGIDLRIEARREESDHTPLLDQNMNTNEDDVSLQSTLEYNQQLLKDQPLPPEEKVITLERSDSEKSRTPFLEQHDSAEKDTKDPRNLQSSSKGTPVASKSKNKHKRRSSLFTNCMCCTTVMN